MADFGRSHLYPDSRARVRAQITCPRCRVDPSHISRQYWEATRQPALPSVDSGAAASGYPDLCPRTSASAGSLRLQQTPVGHSQYPRGAASYYSPSAANVAPPARHADGHTSRTGGETWRIRGVFESHLTPDVTRRTDSNPGPLPDVTRHSSALPPTAIHHTRVASAPVTSGFETPRSAARFSSSDQRHRPLASSFRETTAPRQEPAVRPAPAPWKREQAASPWVTRGQQTESRPVPYTSGNSATTSNTSTSTPIQPSSNSGSTSCWRPVPPHVLSQCPLPDLVTPRRQARKQCCGLLATHSVAVRWLLVVVASLGLLCAIVGTVLGGVVRASGREHLSIALLLVGLGIVLVSMSVVAWRMTSREGAPSCRSMFGLRRARSEPHRRFVPRVPHYGRPHPFSAMLYPDIPLRPPPPSYQASMQEYRLRLLLMDRPQMPSPAPPQHPPPPPPPTYRAPATVYPRFPVAMGPSDYSRPPSYRSRPPSSAGQPSPLGPEDVDLGPPDAPAEEAAARTPAACPRPALPAGNHVEVVAQV